MNRDRILGGLAGFAAAAVLVGGWAAAQDRPRDEGTPRERIRPAAARAGGEVGRFEWSPMGSSVTGVLDTATGVVHSISGQGMVEHTDLARSRAWKTKLEWLEHPPEPPEPPRGPRPPQPPQPPEPPEGPR
jgi:hypothetical protein